MNILFCLDKFTLTSKKKKTPQKLCLETVMRNVSTNNAFKKSFIQFTVVIFHESIMQL